jgi:hypothetical protein
MVMTKIYTDYVNKTAITIPETFIDVKTGESHTVSSKIQDQIEYHAQNNTLVHLLISALTSYLQPKVIDGGTEEILFELSEIKKMMQQRPYIQNNSYQLESFHEKPIESLNGIDLKELEEVLDAFGG